MKIKLQSFGLKAILLTLVKTVFQVLRSAVISLLGLALILAYASYVEPNWLWTSKHTLGLAGINQGQALRIVQISDLHGRTFEQPDYLTEKVNKQQPDLIVLTGDAFEGQMNDLFYIDRYLSPLKATYGKYFVYGNNDHLGTINTIELTDQLQKAGFVVLNNSHVQLSIRGQTLWLIGVDDPHFEKAKLAEAMEGVGEGPKVLLAHSPEIINSAAGAGIELVLVGHTHGGQVRLPLLGNLISNVMPGYEGYKRGLYQKGETQLYVNRGIGMTRVPVRLFVPPEIAVLDLVAPGRN